MGGSLIHVDDHFTSKAYLVKLSTKGEGGGAKKSQKPSTWFKDPLTTNRLGILVTL